MDSFLAGLWFGGGRGPFFATYDGEHYQLIITPTQSFLVYLERSLRR